MFLAPKNFLAALTVNSPTLLSHGFSFESSSELTLRSQSLNSGLAEKKPNNEIVVVGNYLMLVQQTTDGYYRSHP